MGLQHFAALQQANAGYWFDPSGRLQGERALWVPLPENETQELIAPRNMVAHSNAGSRPATWQNLWNFMQSAGQNGEPHFNLDNTGAIAQAISVHVRADCNAKANAWTRNGRRVGAISVETADLGAATLATTNWNLGQLDGLIAIGTALVIQHGLACTVPTSWDDTGIGHHSLFKEWSIYVGKTCPGAQRIRQMDFVRQAVADRVAEYHRQCGAAGIDALLGWFLAG